MKLGTYLSKLPKDQIVYIGCQNGSGFLYCGEAGNSKKIVDEFEGFRLVKENSINTHKNHLKHRLAFGEKFIDDDEMLAKVRYIIGEYNTLISTKEYLGHYVDPLEREICKKYHSIIDKSIIIIIVPGEEVGKYWDKDEFDAVCGEKG